MADKHATQDSPRCLRCGHEFTAGELAAINASEHHEDRSVIRCASCGAWNIARVMPQGGFDHQPTLVMLRIADHDPESGQVFHETVEPGVQVDPTDAGESN